VGGENSGAPSSSTATGSFNPVDQFSDFAPTPEACSSTEITGTIKGTVTESVQGFPIWGARVTADHVGSSPATVSTNEQGAYTLCNLSPGTYRVSATATGFDTSEASTRENVPVQAGATSKGSTFN